MSLQYAHLGPNTLQTIYELWTIKCSVPQRTIWKYNMKVNWCVWCEDQYTRHTQGLEGLISHCDQGLALQECRWSQTQTQPYWLGLICHITRTRRPRGPVESVDNSFLIKLLTTVCNTIHYTHTAQCLHFVSLGYFAVLCSLIVLVLWSWTLLFWFILSAFVSFHQ